jgi:rubrerythrin
MSEKEKAIRVFEYALNQEKTGLDFFRNSLGRMGVGAAVTALKLLISEEEKHVDFINNILKDLKESGEITSQHIEEFTIPSTNYFDERSKSEFLEECVQGSMVPDVTVFNTAWLIEKDLSEFYASTAKQMTGKAGKALGMLSSWEKEHERFFREYRDKLSEVYSKMPWGG